MARIISDNVGTGSDSINRNVSSSINEHRTTIDQRGSADSSFQLSVETGDNGVLRNTTAEDIDTGSVRASFGGDSSVNSGSLSVAADPETDTLTVIGRNEATGSQSSNTTRVSDNSRTSVSIRNEASSRTDFRADINTGDNVIADNASVGDVSTGNVQVLIEVSNRLNAGPAPSPAPTPGPGGGPITPTPSAPSGSPVAAVPNPVSSPSPAVPAIGGDFLPLPTLTLAAASPAPTMPAIGGGNFFAAGASALYPQLALLIAAAAIVGSRAVTQLRNRTGKEGHE